MKIFWKIYFFLYFLQIVGIPVSLIAAQNIPVQVLIDMFFYTISIFAIYGFIYKKLFFNKYFWLIFSPIFIVWDVTYIFEIFIKSQLSIITGSDVFLYKLLGLILHMPLYYALLKYAFDNPISWIQKADKMPQPDS